MERKKIQATSSQVAFIIMKSDMKLQEFTVYTRGWEA